MNMIKKFLTEASVLLYYDASKPITVQCKQQSRLGAILLQDSQPAYAYWAPTDSLIMHKSSEMVAITWLCDKFDQYLYRWDIETNHEPLRSAFRKEIYKSPKCLQQLQYNN